MSDDSIQDKVLEQELKKQEKRKNKLLKPILHEHGKVKRSLDKNVKILEDLKSKLESGEINKDDIKIKNKLRHNFKQVEKKRANLKELEEKIKNIESPEVLEPLEKVEPEVVKEKVEPEVVKEKVEPEVVKEKVEPEVVEPVDPIEEAKQPLEADENPIEPQLYDFSKEDFDIEYWVNSMGIHMISNGNSIRTMVSRLLSSIPSKVSVNDAIVAVNYKRGQNPVDVLKKVYNFHLEKIASEKD